MKPQTAEELMRSRYAAYVERNIDYLSATHDPDTLASFNPKQAARWSREATWEGLEVVSTEGGQVEDEEGVVEFIARYRMDNQSVTHHERSHFRKIDGSWYYHEGVMVKPPPVVRELKVGRNDLCPCGSGKKYKKCCGGHTAAQG